MTNQLPPCPTEDSDNCFWDAQARGNGQGHSFTVVHGVVTYEAQHPAPGWVDPMVSIPLGIALLIVWVGLARRSRKEV